MNSKGHLYVSLAKSGVRILGCILAFVHRDNSSLAIAELAITFGIAELCGGVVEELLDKRD